MAWRVNRPYLEDRMYNVARFIAENFTAIDEAFSLEHRGPGEAGAGKHKPGHVSALFMGTTSEINNLTDVQDGALAFNTTTGCLLKRVGSSWAMMTHIHSRLRAFRSTSTSAATGTTMAATGDIVVFNVVDYDGLSEYNKDTGVFTAKGDGIYAVMATVAVCADGPVPTNSAVGTPAANITTTWSVTGAPSNYQAVDEYPTPNDTDFVSSSLSGNVDLYRSSLSGTNPVPSGTTAISVSVALRARGTGCSCNNTCYGEGCTCYNSCYGHSCSCYNTCYQYWDACPSYTWCGQKDLCYSYVSWGCNCYNTCYGYATCSCNMACYLEDQGGCTCENTCYEQFASRIRPLIGFGGNVYAGDEVALTSAWTQYMYTWSLSPATSQEWTVSEANSIDRFGIMLINNGGIASGCTGHVSQEYLTLAWYPTLPVYILRLWKNDTEVATAYQPIVDAGTMSAQGTTLQALVKLNAGDTLKLSFVAVRNDKKEAIIGESLGSYTYVSIHRVEGQCV